MLHYKELSYNESLEDLKKYKTNDKLKVKLIEIKDDKCRLSLRALESDPMEWFKENDKSVGSVITTRVQEVLKNGVKVAIDKDKKLTTIIKKNDLTKEVSDARLDIYSKGNAIDAKIIELDFEKRKFRLSPRSAQIDEEKSLIKKFGAGATKSGATLKDIFKTLGGKSKKKRIVFCRKRILYLTFQKSSHY